MLAPRLRRSARWIAWGTGIAAGLLLLGGAPAGATGPAYPGETLTLQQDGPSIAGQETNFVASGQQTDVDDDPGGFDLEVFAKDTSIDPTCSPSYLGEEQAELGDEYEQQIVIGLPEGLGTTFSVPFKYIFPLTGQVILCAYSTWVTDTAAAASLVVDITSSSTTTTPPAKPANTARPSIKRAGRKLTCERGSWTGATTYAYAWLVGRRLDRRATRSALAITRALHGHTIVCRVTASNSTGRTAATSAGYHLR